MTGIIYNMAQKGKVTIDSEEELRQLEKELEEEFQYRPETYRIFPYS